MNIERITKFEKWWKKNHHNISGHVWITKNAKRLCHNYNIAPEQYTHAVNIIKRFNCSAYKRLSKKDAEFMWRLLHPTMNQRRERLLATALFLQEKAESAGRKFSK
jgi:hypothetical protein